MSADTLEQLALVLEREAKHWQDHPDCWTPRQDAFPAATTRKAAFASIRKYLDARVYFHRATHTDIVLRDVAYRLRRIAAAERQP